MKILIACALLFLGTVTHAQTLEWEVQVDHAAHIETIIPDGTGGCVAVARGTALDIPYRVLWISNKGVVKKVEVSAQEVMPMMVTPTRFYLSMRTGTNEWPFLRRFDFKKGVVTTTDIQFERPNFVSPTLNMPEDKKGYFVVPIQSDQFEPIGGPVTISRYKH